MLPRSIDESIIIGSGIYGGHDVGSKQRVLIGPFGDLLKVSISGRHLCGFIVELKNVEGEQ